VGAQNATARKLAVPDLTTTVLGRNGLKVPDDISVVGYDDSRLARLAYVNLTTIAQDTATMTRLAVARAIDRIEASAITRRDIVIPPHLVVRGTTGPAPA
jgi:DNA-binding LacI/PurR family transcriptional regulator